MRELYCAFVICGAALLGLAQAPRPSAAAAGQRPDQPPVFRVATRLVQVSVVVHDRDGRPVTDLKKEDFTLTERGKPQPIAFLSMESADSRPVPPAATSPNIFSNVFAERSGVPTGITVILLDLLNTRWADQQYARKALITFLGQIEPQDRIAIYTLGARSLTVLHDYTTDAASLVARLKRARGEIPSQLEASTPDPDSQQELRDLELNELADANQREADFFTGGRVEHTLATLEAIAQHLSGLPGRKNLIWLSGGFPLTIGYDEFPSVGSTRDRRTFTSEMDAAVRALNNSGIAVYPVDARGLMVLPGFDAAARGTVGRAPVTGSRLGPILANIDTMRELADRTGGRAAYNTNDLPHAIRRAIDDARVTYTIGYYPTDQAEDGKFREIKVKVNRPRVDVRYRKGYFALKPSDATVETRESELRDAVWSPLEATAVAMTAQVDFIDAPGAAAIDAILRIDAATVGFTKDGDRWKAELDVVYVQKDESGPAPAAGVKDRISLALEDGNYARIQREGFIRRIRLPRRPGAVGLRIIVRDVRSGSLGSLTVPFSAIPPPPKRQDPAKPAIIGYVFPRNEAIVPSEIAADKLTHINYAFADVRDGRIVEGFARDAENFKLLSNLRLQHPHLQILISVGGWTWSKNFSDAALTAESRRRFTDSAIEFVRRHDIDGVDIDWEYPGLRGNDNVHRREDRENFTAMMMDLRRALDAEGRARNRRYLLTFAAGAFPDFIAHTEMDKVQAVVDFVNLMTYDFRTSDPIAGHHANLYLHPADTKKRSVDSAVREFIAAGVPPAKLVVGVPFYGRVWASVQGDGTGPYQPGSRPTERIETTYGAMATTLIDRGGFVRMWDSQAQAPYLWNKDTRTFISYEDPQSLRLKCAYIRENGLGGAMFWEYYADKSGVLLDTLFTALHGPAASVPRTSGSRVHLAGAPHATR